MQSAVTCRNGHTWTWTDQQPTCPRCGATEALTITRFTETGSRTMMELTQPGIPAAPPLFTGYDVLDVLGAGGMGVVYKARQHALNRIVALKTFHGIEALQPELRERFVAEANAVARLQHPNIIQIFEVGEHAGRRFLALEFVDGTTLSRLLNRKPQAPAYAAEVVELLARATQHAHEAGVLHRDLKPGNVLVPRVTGSPVGTDEEPQYDIRRLKVADFGLAKDLAAPDGPTQLGDVLGTPSYMAPEQASGMHRKLTPAVDTYALGAVLYEMLTGHPPFLGSSSAETVVQVLSQEPVPLRRLRPDCPLDLETICLKCLEKIPSKRYESAAALANDLHCYLTHQPILARPAGTIERLQKWARRKPALAALAISGILATSALVIGGALYAAQLRRHNDRLQKLADSERLAQERAAANLQIARQTVKEMADIAANDLSEVPQLDATRRQVLQKALGLQKQFLQQDASSVSARRDMAEAARFAGDLYQLLGDNVLADQHFRMAASLHRELVAAFPEEPFDQKELAQDLIHLSHVQWLIGNVAETETTLQQADDLLARLMERFPDDPESKFQRARIYLNLGRLYGEGPRPSESEQRIVQARDWLVELSTRFPLETKYREKLATTWVNLGVTLATLGRRSDSVTAYERGGEILAELVDNNPRQRTNRWTLAQLYTNYGNQLWALGRKRAATLAYESSHTQMRRLTQDFPDIPEYRHSLAQSLENVGFMLFRADGFRDNESFWEQVLALDPATMVAGAVQRQEALIMLRDLIAKYPDITAFHASLGYVAANHGIWHRNRRQWSAAFALFELAVTSIRRALQPDPHNRRYRSNLREALWYQAEMHLRLNQLDEAVTFARESAETINSDQSYFYYASQITAQCAVAAADPPAKQRYLKITLDLVRQASMQRRQAIPKSGLLGCIGGSPLFVASQRGWPEAALVRTLPEFQKLLSDPAVQEWLREFEK